MSEEKPKENYNVTSHNQSGGVTAGKVEIHNPTIIGEVEIDNSKIPDNYLIAHDTQNKIIGFRPKIGKWKKPLLAYPLEEKDKVNGRFVSQLGMMYQRMEGYTNEAPQLLFFVAAGGPPSDKDNPYSLHYDILPSYIVIGDDGVATWKIELKK